MRYPWNMSLLSVQINGLLWCGAIFLALFLIVHGAKLAATGYRALRGKRPPEKPEPKPPEKPEPVYFLVERKKKRAKKEYSDPKEIAFR